MTGSPFFVGSWVMKVLWTATWVWKMLLTVAWVYMTTCSQKFLHFSKTAELFSKKSTFVPIFPYYAHKTLFKQELI